MKLALYSVSGKIRQYNLYFLSSLREVFDEVVVTADFEINDKDKHSLSEIGVTKHYSVPECSSRLQQWCYVLSEGFKFNLENIDEILFCSGADYGPVYPFERLWSNLKTLQCDAWGLIEKEKYTDEQSSEFFVARKKAINSAEFREYWDKVRECKPDELKGGYTHLGAYLASSNLIVDYLFSEQFSKLCCNPEILMADGLLNDGYPFLSKSVFRKSTYAFLSDTNANQCEKALEYIKLNTRYPVELILNDLIKTMPNSALMEKLHLGFVIPEDSRKAGCECLPGRPVAHVSKNQTDSKKPKCAIVIFTFFEDLLERNLRIIDQIPDDFKIIVVTSNDSLYARWEKLSLKGKDIELRKQVNRGRNEACYWVTCRDIIESYDYICLMHDKKTSYWGGQGIKGYSYAFHAINSLVKTKDYIENIINIFEANRFIGLLMPYPPMFCGLDCVTSDPWSSNRAIATELYAKLKLSIPFDDFPRAPWGGMFWVRGKAMTSLLRKNWDYSDFPEEPVKPDGTVLHALERMYPMIVQDAGYLSAFVCSEADFSSVYFNTYALLKLRSDQLRAVKPKPEKPPVISQLKTTDSGNAFIRSVTFLDLLRLRSRGFLTKPALKKIRKDRKHFLEYFSNKKELWDPEYYLQENKDVADLGISPIEHYIMHGFKENRNPSRNYRTGDYFEVNPDCLLLNMSPLEHYFINSKTRRIFCSYEEMRAYAREHGIEILKKSSKFNPEYYTKCYREKYGQIPGGFDPYQHYLENGAREIIKTCAHFRVHSYFDKYPELKTYGISPIVHYELLGKYL